MTPKIRKHAKVRKIIPPPHPAIPEKAEISVEDADHLYREIRIENKLQDEKGRTVKLKQGAEVDVIVEADSSATVVSDTSEKKAAETKKPTQAEDSNAKGRSSGDSSAK